MFQLNNTLYRNLEEQVLENKQQIAKHWELDRVLADFGIQVIGRLVSADPYLTDPTYPDYYIGENYGDAYIIGTDDTDSSSVYIWTRPNPNVGHTSPYWLYAGKLSISGPEGPAGRSITNATLNSNYQLELTFSDGSTLLIPQSLKGGDGSPGADGKTPRITATQETGGVRVRTYNGDGVLTGTTFVSNGQNGASIVGPQGPAGKGLNIIGTYTLVSQAPAASGQEMGDAFLLSDGSSTTLYVLTGTPGTPSTYQWQETTFGGGTSVTVGGQVQNTWDADTKVSKITTTSTYNRVYGISTATGETTFFVSRTDTPVSNSLARYDASKQLVVPTTPTADNHAASKQYVESYADTSSSNAIAELEAELEPRFNTYDGYEEQISDLDTRVTTLENSGGGSGGGGSVPANPTALYPIELLPDLTVNAAYSDATFTLYKVGVRDPILTAPATSGPYTFDLSMGVYPEGELYYATVTDIIEDGESDPNTYYSNIVALKYPTYTTTISSDNDTGTIDPLGFTMYRGAYNVEASQYSDISRPINQQYEILLEAGLRESNTLGFGVLGSTYMSYSGVISPWRMALSDEGLPSTGAEEMNDFLLDHLELPANGGYDLKTRNESISESGRQLQFVIFTSGTDNAGNVKFRVAAEIDDGTGADPAPEQIYLKATIHRIQ